MPIRGRLIPSMWTVAFVLATSAANASADAIVVPLSAFSGTEQVVGFNVVTDEPLPYFENGVTFVYTPFGFVSSLFQELNLQRPTTGGSGVLTVTFSDPITIAGFNFRNHFGTPAVGAELFSDLAGLQSLGSVDFGSFARFETAFIGFAASATFTRADITFTVPGAASWFIDDFRFESGAPIPEPGTISLTVLGLAWLGNQMRQRVPRRNV